MKRVKNASWLLFGIVILFAAGATGNAGTTPGWTERVSVANSGAQAGAGGGEASISADGRYVAFSSESALVPEDTNAIVDVFVRDLESGTTERVSVASNGAQADFTGSYYPAISADGRYVAFVSFAMNLVPGDTNGAPDVFVRDRSAGTTERVNLSSTGAQLGGIVGPGESIAGNSVAISGDGRLVAFTTAASDVVPGDTNGVRDIFVRDRQAGTTERVNVGPLGVQADGASDWPAFSRDGSFVAFTSAAHNLTPGLNAFPQTFVRDLQSHTTELVSANGAGAAGNGASAFRPALSNDGRYIAFASDASNLVDGDTNGFPDIFVRDRTLGSVERASLTNEGSEGDGLSDELGGISGDGRFVSFSSFAANLVAGDTNNTRDAFLHDRQFETTERVSVGISGGDADAASFEPLVSDDGAVVAFLSRATNLVPNDTNGRDDIFARHLGEPAVPANDDFGNAEPLVGRGDLVFASNAGATKEAGEPAHAGNVGGASVWYRWTAPSTGPASFSTCESDFDTLLSVYTGAALDSLSMVAANDNSCGTQSSVSFAAVAGTVYQIAIDGSGGATGSFTLDWTLRPPNDDFAAAQTLAGDTGATTGDNLRATTETGEPDHGGVGGASIWYRWTAPAAGFARFETCGSDFDTVLAVYTGTAVSGLTTVAANDDACDLGSSVTFEATAGTVYQVAVAGYDGDQGGVSLHWSRPQVAPQNIVRPALAGTPRDGDTLTGTTGQWNGTAPISFAYAWSRCNGSTCFPIAGAQAASYSLSFADVGWMMRVTVTATNAAGSTQANSLTTAVVAPVAPSNIAIPTVTGTPREGEVLTAGPGTWKGTGTVAFAYQWQACVASGSDCTNLPGETNQTLPLAREHVGSTIRVVVTATNGVGSAQGSSTITSAVEGIAPTIVAPPTLRGTPRQGQVLTAQGGTWNGSQPISRAYHWQACNRSGTGCKNLPGKTAPKLLLGAAQAGTRIRVIETATNVAAAAQARSAATATVTAAQRCVVPNVKGKTLAAARSAINRAHCTTGHTTNAYSHHVPKGYVVSQSPRARTRGAAGTRVNLVISRGVKSQA